MLRPASSGGLLRRSCRCMKRAGVAGIRARANSWLCFIIKNVIIEIILKFVFVYEISFRLTLFELGLHENKECFYP